MIAAIDMISSLEEIWGGDVDLGLRLKEASRQIYIACNADLVHTSFLTSEVHRDHGRKGDVFTTSIR